MKRTDLLLSLLLLAATAIAYAPAYRGEFIWDDDRHVSQNPLLRSAAGLKAIWTEVGATPQYYPLTHTSFWIEWQLWGNHVVGYHAVNVALHAIASLLVVMLLRQLRLPGAWLAGFVFALHPLHVESVAWISERKNTLSISFALLSLLAYLRSRPDLCHEDSDHPEPDRTSLFWAASLVLYLCATWSKTLTCTLPAVMLVIVWWKRGRIGRRDVVPLLPFFAIAAGAAALTGGMERSVVGAEGDDWALSWAERTLVAARAFWWYAMKVAWPGELAFSYERWSVDAQDWIGWAIVATAAGVLMGAALGQRFFGRGLAAGVLIFAGTLFPALGFFNLYPHRYSFVADHFQYHSDVALIALLCAGLASIKVSPRVGVVWSALLIGVLGVMSYEQSKIYRDQETLWHDTIAKTPTSWMAHYNLGANLVNRRPDDPVALEEAIVCFNRTQSLRPTHDLADFSRGNALSLLGRTEEADRAYDAAAVMQLYHLGRNPGSINPYVRLIDIYDRRGWPSEALAIARKASDEHPGIAHFAEQAGKRLADRESYADAAVYLARWASARPRSVEARMALANCYDRLDRVVEARRAMLDAAAIAPDDPAVRNALDYLRARLTRPPATTPSSAAETRPE